MIEKKLRVFINCIWHYFEHSFNDPADIGVPYLIDSISEVDADYTGLISISGAYQGVCCFTTPRGLLEKVITDVGVGDTSKKMLHDTAGEIANTLSGNARKQLGSDFIISVPIVIEGKVDEKYFPDEVKVYAIPIKWRDYKATLGVCLI